MKIHGLAQSISLTKSTYIYKQRATFYTLSISLDVCIQNNKHCTHTFNRNYFCCSL